MLWKESVVSFVEFLFRQVPGGIKRNHGILAEIRSGPILNTIQKRYCLS
jgi:hypothetical protein